MCLDIIDGKSRIDVVEQLRVKQLLYNKTANRIKKSRKSQVSFGSIEERFYEMTLVDHPGSTYGPPIGLRCGSCYCTLHQLKCREFNHNNKNRCFY